MTNPPSLTPEQRAAALAKAAEARAAMAAVKQQLRNEELSFSEALERCGEPAIGKLKVLAALEALPGVGKVKARRMMESIGIAEGRRIQGLGAQQRAALLEQLEG